jgi:hypothetical protein
MVCVGKTSVNSSFFTSMLLGSVIHVIYSGRLSRVSEYLSMDSGNARFMFINDVTALLIIYSLSLYSTTTFWPNLPENVWFEYAVWIVVILWVCVCTFTLWMWVGVSGWMFKIFDKYVMDNHIMNPTIDCLKNNDKDHRWNLILSIKC